MESEPLIVLLVVACKVFDRSSQPVHLPYTECHGSRHHLPQAADLGIVFKVSSQANFCESFTTRCQPQCYVEQLHLMADHLADSLDRFYIPALCQVFQPGLRYRTDNKNGSAFFCGGRRNRLPAQPGNPCCYDFTVIYLISFFQTKTCGLVYRRAMVVTFHGSSDAHRRSLCCCRGTEIPC